MSQHDGPQPSPYKATAGNIGQLFSRLFDLAELQAELLKIDARDGLRALILPVVMLAMGVVLGFGCAVTLLLALAALLHLWLPVTWSLLIASLAGLLLAAVAIFTGRHLMGNALAAFDRSKSELRKNAVWLKESLKKSSRNQREERIAQV